MPLKQIASRLGISPATVCGWCRDIVLSDDQIVAIHRAQAANADAGRVAQGRRCHADRAAAQAHGRRMARSGDPVHLAGCMLYWAEGAKNPNHVRLANTDAGMLQYFRLFLFRCYGVEDEEIRLTVNCFLNNGLSLDEIETW